jgi:hypothetical protein
VTGIEPASPAWKAGALAIELHPRTRVKIPAARQGAAVVGVLPALTDGFAVVVVLADFGA